MEMRSLCHALVGSFSVLQANEDADLDFLAGKSGAFVPRDNH